MSLFQYTARDQRLAVLRGTVVADSPRQARDLLRARGLMVDDLREPREPLSLGKVFRRRRATAQRVGMFVRDLATLLAVGLPLVEAISTVSRQYRGSFHETLLLLREKVQSGSSLAEAMTTQPGIFDELTIRMVEVGENSGNLDAVLGQLADYQEKSVRLKDRVLGALMYPAIVFATSLFVTGFLMTVVVPMLLSNLQETGQKLPWPTRVLKQASDFLLAYGVVTGLVVGVLLLLFMAWTRLPTGERIWHGLLLRVPVLGSMLQRQVISRLSMILATLLRSGLEYLKALEIATRSTSNAVIREALVASGEAIRAGREIGPALEKTGAFPPVVVQVFTVGQESGRLEEMLDRLAVDYDRQVESLSNRFASILEPILILILALFVGFILFATLLPILEAGNVLRQ